MPLGFRIVDVFTDSPFSGNQLCVFPEIPPDLDAATMQRLALEIGFSESTFVLEAAGDRYRMRIFTPDEEIPFAGHPTLGTAYVLAQEGRVAPAVIQTTEAGDVHVEIDLEAASGWMRQLPPVFGAAFDDRAIIAAAAGLEPDDLVEDLPLQTGSTGLVHMMVPVRDEPTLRRATRNGQLAYEVYRRTGATSLYLFVVRGDGDVMARMFDTMIGIGEDPATGSAAGPLGAYLSTFGVAGMPGKLVVAQGELVNRPSTLHVEIEPDGDSWAVRVGGGVHVVGHGAFEI